MHLIYLREFSSRNAYNDSMRTVYIETSVVSYLTSKSSRDLLIAACQQATHTWWEEYRLRFELYTSRLVLAEASSGDSEAARKRSGCFESIPELQLTDEVRDLARVLVQRGALPHKAEAGALHIAVAAVHRVDILLTWNCRHIDNPVTKPMIRSVCAENGYVCPEICTPLELLEVCNHEE